MTREPTRVSDATFAELRRHFDEGEIVEIAAVVGLFNYFNRFNEALRMEPTRPGEGVDS
jgi:alkylhydroperoxidase family enzyme